MSMGGVMNVESSSTAVSPAAIQILTSGIVKQQANKPETGAVVDTLSTVTKPPVQSSDFAQYLQQYQYRKQVGWRKQRSNGRALLFGLGGFIFGITLWSMLNRESRKSSSSSTSIRNTDFRGAKRRRRCAARSHRNGTSCCHCRSRNA